MDKEKKNIDEIFKEGLSKRSFEIPVSFESDLTERLDMLKKKRRGFFLWWLLLFGIVDFSLIALLFINNKQEAVYVMTSNPTELIQSTSVSVNATKTPSTAIQLKRLQDSEKGIDNKAARPELETESLDARRQHSNNSWTPNSNTRKEQSEHLENKKQAYRYSESKDKGIAISNTSEVEKSEKEINKKDVAVHSSNPDQENRKSSDQQTFLTNEKIKSEQKTSSFKEDNNEPLQYSIEKTSDQKDKTLPPSENNQEEERQANTITKKFDNSAITTSNSSEIQLDTSTLHQENKVLEDLPINEDRAETKTKKETNGLHQGTKTISKWSTEIQLYAGFGGTIINDKAPSESYLGSVNENRKPLTTPTFGVNGNFSYKNITFGLGASYLQTGEKYSTNMNKIKFTDTPTLVHDSIIENVTYYMPNGVIIGDSAIITVDTSTQIIAISDTTKLRREIKNRYSWISIPVYFGYHFSFGKYVLTPRIGAQFNFGITQNSGQYPNSNFEDISTFNATKFNVSYLLNIELKRNFNHWSLFVRPYFKSMIGPAINESILKRKYSSWGVQVGVGFDL